MARLTDLTPISEADFRHAAARLARPFAYDPEALDFDRAMAAQVVLSFGVRHTLGPNPHFAVRWRGTVQAPEIRPSFHALAERLRGVQLLCRDGVSVMERLADEEGCVTYVDPPYGGLQDYGVNVDRARLRAALLAMKGPTAVSGFDDEWDADLLPAGWRKTTLERAFHGMGRTGGGQTDARTEALWLNFPDHRRGRLF